MSDYEEFDSENNQDPNPENGGPVPNDDDSNSLVLASEVLPQNLPIIPLRPRPAFPGIMIPLNITGEEKLATVRYALESESHGLGLVMVQDVEGEDSPDNLYAVGVASKITKVIKSEEDHIQILVNCLERFSIQDVRQNQQGLFAYVRYHYAPDTRVNEELKAYSMAIITTLKELVQLNPLYSEEIKMFLNRSSMDDPGRLADFAANLTSADGAELQDILETLDIRARIDKVLTLLKKELEVSRIQSKISKQIEEKVSAQQREYFLKEQLKAIKKELGLEKEGKTAEVEKFQERLKDLHLNEEAEKAVQEELEKFQLLEPASPEYNVTRTYLDWLTVLPWGKFSKDSYNIAKARKTLDRDHYGLEDVKERILEFIAVGKMKGDISGSILCLVGPPGVGKTSVGRSIASALDRKFYRFSLGGIRDEAEIKGHRRTYIGAMPGKFIQAIKSAGTANPVLMLDEIDKVGASYQGDPASALLEVLDPEQNSSFKDHYLDVPFDLSNVLFVATANQLDTIPKPLLDRMEVIRLSGYILEEKLEIARRYLVPKARESHGLPKGSITLRKTALEQIVERYAREAGVRGLENRIKKIMRKAAMRIAEDSDAKLTVGKKDLEQFLGQPVYTDDEIFESGPGIVTGLAWTQYGGTTLQVEATATPSKQKGFKQTGQLGKVMVESSEIAYAFVMAKLQELGADSAYFDNHFINLHVPAGATPKDGPSAGITMATALISMITRQPVIAKLGMTGELTLTGRVLPIGGVKEKVIAARRAGLKELIFPEGNRKDVLELPEYLQNGLNIHYAQDFDNVLRLAFEKFPKVTN